MSGNSKQRRVFRRALARKGLRYVPPSDFRRRFVDPAVYLEMPAVVSGYAIPGPPGFDGVWLRPEARR